MNFSNTGKMLALCVLAGNAPLYAADPRDPLGYADHGLYGGLPNSYFFDPSTPFDFMTAQTVPAYGSAYTYAANWNNGLQQARSSGKRVIAVLNPQILDSNNNLITIADLGSAATPQQVEAFGAVIDAFFTQVNPDDLYAVSIGEEHIFWNGRSETLNAVYDRIKANHNVPVFQWHTPSSIGTAPGISGFPNLKSDGWIADEYLLDQPAMEKNMRAYVIQQKPVVQTIWAGGSAITSVPYDADRFDAQTEVLKKYDIAANYFVWSGVGGWNGYESEAPQETQDKFQKVHANAVDAAGYTGPDYATWDSVPWETPTIELGFTGATDIKPSYKEDYRNDRVVRFINDAAITGFSDLRWDATAVELRPRHAGNASASVAYNFASAFPLSQLRIRADGFVANGTNGDITMSLVDENGQTIQSTGISPSGELAMTVPGLALSGREFKVVYSLTGSAGAAGDVLAGVNSIEVEADVHLPVQKAITLAPPATGAMQHKEDLASMSIFHTAEFKNAQKVRYSNEGLHANTAAGQLEVIQQFLSPRALTLNALHALGQATGDARFGIGISLDGQNMIASQMSTTDFGGTLDLSLSSLTQSINSNKFYVHLLLTGAYGIINSYSIDATVAPLEHKSDFGTPAQLNEFLWYESATGSMVSNTPPDSVKVTPGAADVPSNSSYAASDRDGDSAARVLYMEGASSPNDMTLARPFSADPFMVFEDIHVSADAASAHPEYGANATGVFIGAMRTSYDKTDFAADNEMQRVSLTGGAEFDGASRFWAGGKLSNKTTYSVENGWYASRLANLEVTTSQRNPHPGERVLLTNNDLGTTVQQKGWSIAGTGSAGFFASNEGDVSNDLLASGVRLAGSTEAARSGYIAMILEISAPDGQMFSNIVATADTWAYSAWGSVSQLLLSNDKVNWIEGNIAMSGDDVLSVGTAGVAGYESVSTIWLQIYLRDLHGFDIDGHFAQVRNLLVTGELVAINPSTVPEPGSLALFMLAALPLSVRRRRG